MEKEICFVSEGVPIRHNVKHLGLQGHVWSEGLIYATGCNSSSRQTGGRSRLDYAD